MGFAKSEYEYYAKKTPFRKILEDLCDLEIDSYRVYSNFGGNYTYQYNISYNQKKFIENIVEIKNRLLKTSFCKNIAEVKERVENIPDSLFGFATALDISHLMNFLILDGSLKEIKSSRRFSWDVKDRYSEDLDFNVFCAKKMVRPMICFVEINGWERERWNFFFEYPNDEDLDIWIELKKRINAMPKVNQVLGESYFDIQFVPKEYNTISFNSGGGYFYRNNLIEGKLERVGY